MKPKIEYKPEAETLTEALGVTEEEVFRLVNEVRRETDNGGEFMALLWERAPTPQHALLGAFFMGCFLMYLEGSKIKEEEDDGADSEEGIRQEG